MIKEFVSFEQARELKELGFDEPCFTRFYQSGKLADSLFFILHNYFSQINAPLWQQAFKFFRDKYSTHSHISKYKDNNFYHYDIFVDVVEEGEEYYESYACNVLFNTYEEAQSACLDKLIELTKEANNGKEL